MSLIAPSDARPPRAMPVLLALVAGAVDACTFLALFGLFVAQLTGSFVTIGVEIVKHEPMAAMHLLALPLFFLAGVMIALLTQRLAHRALALALAIEAALLAAFTATGLLAAPFAHATAPLAVLTGVLGLMAMGVQSAAVRLMLPGTPSTNVMTINTTQLAIETGQWLIGAVEPNAAARTAARARVTALGTIMGAFLAGSVLGAVGFTFAGFWCGLPLVAIVLGLSIWAGVHQP